MAHYTLVRLYYVDPKGKRAVAPANTVVFDLKEEAAEDAIARGYIREATIGEIAEAGGRPEAKKKVTKAKADEKVEPEKTDAGKTEPEKTSKTEDLA